MVIAHITKYLAFTTYILQVRGTKIEKLLLCHCDSDLYIHISHLILNSKF